MQNNFQIGINKFLLRGLGGCRAFLFFVFLLINSLVFAQKWEMQDVKTDAGFRSISVVSEKTVWASGTKGTVVKTTDGGKTWEVLQVPDAGNLDFRDIHAINDKIAYLMSAGESEKGQARLYKTTDGGKTFSLIYQTQEKGVFFDAMDFWDENHGIVFSDPVNGKFFILTTGDGGKTWTQVPPENLPPTQENEAAFAASGSCLVVQGKQNVWIGTGGKGGGRVLYSTDAGKTWHVSPTPFQAGETVGICGLYFSDAKTGFAVGGDFQNPNPTHLSQTQDGGKTWQLVENQEFKLLEAVTFADKKMLVAIGQGTFISKDFGKTWQKIDDAVFHAVGSKGKTVWAVGGKGKIGKMKIAP